MKKSERTASAGKGFTLVEMVIAIGVFSVMSTVIAGAFSTGFSSYRSSRELQRDVEAAQYSMNVMAKHLRTSTVLSPDGPDGNASSVLFYDYSSGRCFQYRFRDGILEARWQTSSTIDDDDASLSECDAVPFGAEDWHVLTSGAVSGHFHVVPSDATVGDGQVGRIVIYMSVREKETSRLESSVQTTVSLRDYDQAGY